MKINEILEKLTEQTDYKLVLDKDNKCSIKLDGKYIVTLEPIPESENFYLYSCLGELTPEHEAKILKKLLEANLFGNETSSASFGLDKESKLIVLHRLFEADQTDYLYFERAFLEFYEILKNWTSKLNEDLQEVSEDSLDFSVLKRQAMMGSGKDKMKIIIR